MNKQLVGVFDDFTAAQTVRQELLALGYADSQIELTANDQSGGYTRTQDPALANDGYDTKLGSKIGGFLEKLFGPDVERDERDLYGEALRRGCAMVTVRGDETLLPQAIEIMNRHGAIDLKHRGEHFRKTGYTQFDDSAPYSAAQIAQERETYGKLAIPVIQEELQVGKQVVQRGGVRIHSLMTEKPVEATVNLREEHVTVERRPADRPVTEADLQTLQQGDLTITEKAEQAVVGKQAHVVEEVLVDKTVESHDETITDSVRRTDVEVENIERARQNLQSGLSGNPRRP